MFGISFEHLLIFTVILFIFGPKHLPKMGYTLGKAYRNLKNAYQGEIEPEFKRLESKDDDHKA